jgi:ArsR family transcriptional regulator
MRHFIGVTKALACEKRARILMALRNRGLCESVITVMLGLAPVTTSRHLWLLRQAEALSGRSSVQARCR